MDLMNMIEYNPSFIYLISLSYFAAMDGYFFISSIFLFPFFTCSRALVFLFLLFKNGRNGTYLLTRLAFVYLLSCYISVSFVHYIIMALWRLLFPSFSQWLHTLYSYSMYMYIYLYHLYHAARPLYRSIGAAV